VSNQKLAICGISFILLLISFPLSRELIALHRQNIFLGTHERKFDTIISLVNDGTYVRWHNSYGVISLPPDLASSTCNGKIVVGRLSNGNQVILFPMQAETIQMSGIIYADRPLGRPDLNQNGDLEFNDANGQPIIPYAPIVRHIKGHWYYMDNEDS
jgi:hypothetical protein